VLVGAGRTPAGGVTVVNVRVTRPRQAYELLETHDLVIDATAHGSTSAVLASASAATRRPLISACLIGDGAMARVDRWPLENGEEHDLLMHDGESTREMLREGGCGDPISPASPIAVTAAAVLAAESAVELLTGRHVAPTLTRSVGGMGA
jgi:hypothetical protein